MITSEPYSHITFTISNQTPICIPFDFANCIISIHPKYWKSSIKIRQTTLPAITDFTLDTNISDNRYPNIQMNIPARLAYQHQPPGSSLTFLNTTHHSDSDPDLSHDDNYDITDPSPPHTYNPTKLRPNANTFLTHNQQPTPQTTPTVLTQLSSPPSTTESPQPSTTTNITSTTSTSTTPTNYSTLYQHHTFFLNHYYKSNDNTTIKHSKIKTTQPSSITIPTTRNPSTYENTNTVNNQS